MSPTEPLRSYKFLEWLFKRAELRASTLNVAVRRRLIKSVCIQAPLLGQLLQRFSRRRAKLDRASQHEVERQSKIFHQPS